MYDLRRQALESGKTVSRKARNRLAVDDASNSGRSAGNSRNSSAKSSRAASRNVSRNASRAPSDDEDDNASVGTDFSTNSIDELLSGEDVDAPPDVWIKTLQDRIEEIIDRKRSSTQSREEAMEAYIRVLTAHYAKEEIEKDEQELIAAFLKSVKAESSEQEAILALKALALTVVTDPSDEIFDATQSLLKRTITDSESERTKAAAIHTLSAVTFYGGASLEATEEVMAFLLEIIESDGHSTGAGDSGSVVTSALEAWGFLATQLEDLEDLSEEACDAFVEQLDSSDVDVQIAAGENIALLYEKSYSPLGEDEEADDDSEDDAGWEADRDHDEDDRSPHGPKMVKRYDVYRREDQLVHTLESLANLSSKRLSKKDKKSLHTNFADIVNSVEDPTRGPRYQKAVSHMTGKRYGSRMTVKIRNVGEMKIDKWWKLHRLQALKRILQGGFVTHYEQNEVVFDSLPVMVSMS